MKRGVMDASVDSELGRLISKRASQDRRPDPDELEPGYIESVRRYNARQREENRLAWCDYFSHLAGALRARAEEYDHRAQTLMEDEPKGAA